MYIYLLQITMVLIIIMDTRQIKLVCTGCPINSEKYLFDYTETILEKI